jgi:hypothetical protein
VSFEISRAAPARYFPVARGLYEVAPGLKPLGTDFGNGAMDGRVFQIDSEFPRFRESKSACRRDRLSKYVQHSDLSPAVERALVEWFIHRLISEHAAIFTRDRNRLLCGHTGDEISLGDEYQLLPDSQLSQDYESAFDALANQVSEDICLMRRAGSRNWLAAAHLCSPSHWSAEDKIGKPFTTIHEPVPGIDSINRRADQFVDMMIHRGPLVRFAWGFGTDDRLNHHPHPPAGVDPVEWRGRCFDPLNPRLFLRVERQVTCGLPAVDAAVFVIRISHLSGDQIRSNPVERDQVISAMKSMTPSSRHYKGVFDSLDAIECWLMG